jgi:hypothetical protein
VENAKTPEIIKKMAKAKPISVILPAVGVIGALCYLPLSKYLR